MATIWGAAGVAPSATDRVPVDVSASGGASRVTMQQIADLENLVGKTVNALGSIGTNTDIDLSLGSVVTATITGALTFTFSNVPSNGSSFALLLTDGGSAALTFPVSVTFVSDSPTLRASGKDVIIFRTPDGGTTWFGEVVGDPSAHASSHATAGSDPIAPADIGAAAASHTHALGDLTQSGATTGQAAVWNGSAWAPGAAGANPAGSSAELQVRSSSTTFGAVANSYYDSGTGRIGIGVGSSPAGRMHVGAGSATEVPLIAQGAASQTANLFEARNSAGTKLVEVSPTGKTSWQTHFFDPATGRFFINGTPQFCGYGGARLGDSFASRFIWINWVGPMSPYLSTAADDGYGTIGPWGFQATFFGFFGPAATSTNYERLRVDVATSGAAEIKCESAGTGAANIDLKLTPLGSGAVRFGSHSALGGESLSGYVEIKDAGGTVRKLAVVS